MPGQTVTRFAPSPTGYLHIGGARTALFNWLFARHTGGKFLLRIEDTDVKRNTASAMQQVIKDLRWLGIDWDEGPQAGGPNGPYLQSQRMDIYDKYIKQLLEKRKAYYCFDTVEELQAMRAKAEAEVGGFLYPRPKEFPDENALDKAKAQGRPVVVRFAMPAGEIVVKDQVRGEVRFKGKEIGDFVIKKSDGFPTYHFACVVDDELMGVTHVIRGQEHLMNTPGHHCLQDALGFRRPVYAHMSVTVSPGGGKLSKRERPKVLRAQLNKNQQLDLEGLASAGGISTQEAGGFLKGDFMPDMPNINAMAEFAGVHLPEINVADFFNSGYVPEAVVNFIALLGFNPKDEREIMSVQELIDCFELSRLTKSNSLFDRQKLVAFNTEHIRIMDKQKLLEHFKSYVCATGSPVCDGDDDLLGRLVEVNAGARTLAQIEKKSTFLFVDDDEPEYEDKAVRKVLLKPGAMDILSELREKLSEMEELSHEAIEAMLREMARAKQVGLGKVAQPLRVAISGGTISPPIFDSVDMLGREKTLKRIDNALEKFGS